jgi:hypothetical protein
MSCLFNSLSYFINGTSDEIRQVICNYLQENKPLIDGLDTNFILSLDNNNYINNMRNSSTWGGAIEIQAACNIWNIRIIVINKRSNENTYIEFLPVNNNYKHTIKLEWNGSHYEPIS